MASLVITTLNSGPVAFTSAAGSAKFESTMPWAAWIVIVWLPTTCDSIVTVPLTDCRSVVPSVTLMAASGATTRLPAVAVASTSPSPRSVVVPVKLTLLSAVTVTPPMPVTVVGPPSVASVLAATVRPVSAVTTAVSTSSLPAVTPTEPAVATRSPAARTKPEALVRARLPVAETTSAAASVRIPVTPVRVTPVSAVRLSLTSSRVPAESVIPAVRLVTSASTVSPWLAVIVTAASAVTALFTSISPAVEVSVIEPPVIAVRGWSMTRSPLEATARADLTLTGPANTTAEGTPLAVVVRARS